MNDQGGKSCFSLQFESKRAHEVLKYAEVWEREERDPEAVSVALTLDFKGGEGAYEAFSQAVSNLVQSEPFHAGELRAF